MVRQGSSKRWNTRRDYWILAILLFISVVIPTNSNAACSSPVGTAGELRWFPDERQLKWCDDYFWGYLYTTQTQGTYYGGVFDVGELDQSGLSIVGKGNDFVGLTVWDRDGDDSTVDDGDGTIFWGDHEGNQLVFAFYYTGVAGLWAKMVLTSDGSLGIYTTMPRATLDVNGYAKLTINSAAPAACDATYKGSVALTSATRMCVCDGASWKEVNNAADCAW